MTTFGFLQRIFDTTELSFAQWSICIGIAASLVVVEELIKLLIRPRDRRSVTPGPSPRCPAPEGGTMLLVVRGRLLAPLELSEVRIGPA